MTSIYLLKDDKVLLLFRKGGRVVSDVWTGSAGKILDIMKVRIDSDDPYNITGEIQVCGENVMKGYYKNELKKK